MTALRLLAVYVRVGILNELEYRVNFYVQLLQSFIGLFTALLGLSIVFTHTETLAGWRQFEIVALVGVYFLVGGFIRTIVQPSMARFIEDVRQGTLDFTLTKPADAQMLVSIKQVEIWRTVDILLGVALIGIALAQIGAEVGLAQAGAFGIALLAGAAMVYSFWLILSTTTFWFVRMENIHVIFLAMWESGRWPATIYPGWLRAMMTFIVPVAFATTVPAEALAGRLTGETLLVAVALAVALLVGSRLFWLFGLRHYSGASA